MKCSTYYYSRSIWCERYKYFKDFHSASMKRNREQQKKIWKGSRIKIDSHILFVFFSIRFPGPRDPIRIPDCIFHSLFAVWLLICDLKYDISIETGSSLIVEWYGIKIVRLDDYYSSMIWTFSPWFFDSFSWVCPQNKQWTFLCDTEFGKSWTLTRRNIWSLIIFSRLFYQEKNTYYRFQSSKYIKHWRVL